MQREIKLPENPTADKIYRFLERKHQVWTSVILLTYFAIGLLLPKFSPISIRPNQKVYSETKNVFRVRKNDSPGVLFSPILVF
ncbi:MAG: hypothetical protein IPL27_16060 [Lewinellaceae bacterium]|nr:hypothetical protein [Lewinellaceae bacterium]